MLKQDIEDIDHGISAVKGILEQREKIPLHDFLNKLAWTLYQVPKLKLLASGFESSTDHIHQIITTFVHTDALQSVHTATASRDKKLGDEIKKLLKAQEEAARLHKQEVKKFETWLKSIQERENSVVEDAIIDARSQKPGIGVQEVTVMQKNEVKKVVEGVVKDSEEGQKPKDEILKSTKKTTKQFPNSASLKKVKSKISQDSAMKPTLQKDITQPTTDTDAPKTTNSKISTSKTKNQKSNKIENPKTSTKPSQPRTSLTSRTKKKEKDTKLSPATSSPKTLESQISPSPLTKPKSEKSIVASNSSSGSPILSKPKIIPVSSTKQKSEKKSTTEPASSELKSKPAGFSSPSTKHKSLNNINKSTSDTGNRRAPTSRGYSTANKSKVDQDMTKAASLLKIQKV